MGTLEDMVAMDGWYRETDFPGKPREPQGLSRWFCLYDYYQWHKLYE